MRLTGAGLLAVTLSIAILTVRPDGSVVDWTDLPFFGGLLTVDFRTLGLGLCGVGERVE